MILKMQGSMSWTNQRLTESNMVMTIIRNAAYLTCVRGTSAPQTFAYVHHHAKISLFRTPSDIFEASTKSIYKCCGEGCKGIRNVHL